MLCKQIGQQIRQKREDLNLELDDAASRAGIDASYLEAIEECSIQFSVADASNMFAIANILNLNLNVVVPEQPLDNSSEVIQNLRKYLREAGIHIHSAFTGVLVGRSIGPSFGLETPQANNTMHDDNSNVQKWKQTISEYATNGGSGVLFLPKALKANQDWILTYENYNPLDGEDITRPWTIIPPPRFAPWSDCWCGATIRLMQRGSRRQKHRLSHTLTTQEMDRFCRVGDLAPRTYDLARRHVASVGYFATNVTAIDVTLSLGAMLAGMIVLGFAVINAIPLLPWVGITSVVVGLWHVLVRKAEAIVQ